MVSKLVDWLYNANASFRAVLFRMVSKHAFGWASIRYCFRAVLFRMVSKLLSSMIYYKSSFRAVLFRMVLKYTYDIFGNIF